jgi:hypothetical protein
VAVVAVMVVRPIYQVVLAAVVVMVLLVLVVQEHQDKEMLAEIIHPLM